MKYNQKRILTERPQRTKIKASKAAGKRHDNVLRSVRTLIKNKNIIATYEINLHGSSSKAYYVKTTYKDKKNREKPMYLLNQAAAVVLSTTYVETVLPGII